MFLVSCPSSSMASTMTRFSIDDPSHPLCIHHVDSPEQILVSHVLTWNNYNSWSCATTITLIAKNKLGFTDGNISPPQNLNSNMFRLWLRNNNIVIYWILNFVSKEIAASVMFSSLAWDIWMDLKDHFQQRNGPRIFQLHHELMNLRQEKCFCKCTLWSWKSFGRNWLITCFLVLVVIAPVEGSRNSMIIITWNT